MKLKSNTRFVPTITGPLHMGHLYLVLVNEAEARRTGGKFSVRVDDTQPHWHHKMGTEAEDMYCEQYREQISSFVHVDEWHRQSRMLSPREIVGDLPILDRWERPNLFYANSNNVFLPEKLGYLGGGAYPSYLLNKIIWDFYMGTKLMIRGEDLIYEASLYDYFGMVIGLTRLVHIYLPHLMDEDTELGISKTGTTYPIQKQINEFGVEGTIQLLRKACLIDPYGEFVVSNIVENPVAKGMIK